MDKTLSIKQISIFGIIACSLLAAIQIFNIDGGYLELTQSETFNPLSIFRGKGYSISDLIMHFLCVIQNISLLVLCICQYKGVYDKNILAVISLGALIGLFAYLKNLFSIVHIAIEYNSLYLNSIFSYMSIILYTAIFFYIYAYFKSCDTVKDYKKIKQIALIAFIGTIAVSFSTMYYIYQTFNTSELIISLFSSILKMASRIFLIIYFICIYNYFEVKANDIYK